MKALYCNKKDKPAQKQTKDKDKPQKKQKK